MIGIGMEKIEEGILVALGCPLVFLKSLPD